MSTNSSYPFLRSAILLVSLIVFTWNTVAGWQDDPFDPFAPAGAAVPDTEVVPSATPPVDALLDKSLSDGVRLVIQSLRDSNPTTPIDLVRAVNSMLNVKQYDEANSYLTKLVNSNPDDEQLYELVQTMGPAFFLELRDQRELQPQSQQFADRVFAAARAKAFAPARIEALITNLSNDDRFVRLEALRKLSLLGAPAAAAMLNACSDPKRNENELPFIQSGLKQMGEPAMLPLIGAARADGTVTQAVAIGALSNIESELAFDTLYRAAISANVPERVRSIAAEAIGLGNTVSPLEIEQRIFDRANDYLDGQIDLPADANGDVEIWNWNFEADNLRPTKTNHETAKRILAVDLARDVWQLNQGNPQYRQLLLLTVVDATKRVLGPNRFVLPEEVARYVDAVSMWEVNLALDTALQRELFPAAIGAAELLGQIGDPSLLSTADAKPSGLVRALLTGQRHLQYAAAKSIADLDPQSTFPGCSFVAQIMTFLARSDGTSAGLASHPRPDIAQSLASSISQSGLIGRTVNSAQQLFDVLQHDPDIELVLVTDAYSRPHYQELVQQIRRQWLTQRLPVALVTSDPDRESRASIVIGNDPLTIVTPLTADPHSVYAQIQRLRELHEPWPVSNAQRDQHADFALAWLAKVLADQSTYRFYHLTCYRDELAQLIQFPGHRDLKAQILQHLGTAGSQRSLVSIASETSLPLDERMVVADAFAESVKSSGILLNTDELQSQYDRFNAAESQSPESQQILAGILDTLESRRPR